MIDLNTLFAEFLNKAIAAAVAEQTQALVEQNELLMIRVTELENQLGEMAEKVDEADVERAIERHMEGINLTEMLDFDHIAEEVLSSRAFPDAVRETVVDALQGGGRRF